MKMIIGGAWQGQLIWAKENCPEVTDEQWIDGKTCELEAIFTCKGIYDFHEYVRRRMMTESLGLEGDHPVIFEKLAEEIIQRNPQIVIVSDEIGYGLVPVDAFERAYREQVGRVCTALAGFSEEVVRVVMGIGNHIKEK